MFVVVVLFHKSFAECQEAFDWGLSHYVYFGGYPGAAPLIDDDERWARYIVDSIIETSISRDMMLITDIRKPALLRAVFELGCHCSGRILSYHGSGTRWGTPKICARQSPTKGLEP